ncbi:hypothetical protein SAMN06265222_1032 [Neorhodopirellula lusitana]|uniref:Uncharacterized protein n=1 Tax=Neorhodopirellula lusitana TaxID=445327 RepID=A0ABY1PV30_9BACT|nr:hypothetical protein SAMN06265222_1032 [Neorhodopirellula lusitana]
MRNCMAIDFANALAKAILWGPPAGGVEPCRCLGLCAAVSLVPVSSFPSLCPGRCVLAAVQANGLVEDRDVWFFRFDRCLDDVLKLSAGLKVWFAERFEPRLVMDEVCRPFSDFFLIAFLARAAGLCGTLSGRCEA